MHVAVFLVIFDDVQKYDKFIIIVTYKWITCFKSLIKKKRPAPQSHHSPHAALSS